MLIFIHYNINTSLFNLVNNRTGVLFPRFFISCRKTAHIAVSPVLPFPLRWLPPRRKYHTFLPPFYKVLPKIIIKLYATFLIIPRFNYTSNFNNSIMSLMFANPNITARYISVSTAFLVVPNNALNTSITRR